jgi:GWxTD domain-containing protein
MNVRVFAAACLALGLFLPAAVCFQSPKLRKELESGYKKWFDEDVAYIISSEERQAWKRLANDEEREQFVEQFWLRRDPTPDTVENEFKEEHYRRIAYANQRYASGIPGWRTDRGRIYITYGPPDEIEDHSAGGTYQRPQEQGGGTTSVYPFQQWRYRWIEGVGTNIIIEFVDTTMTGEFRMTMDPSEKDALQHVPTGLPKVQQGITFKAIEQNVQLQRPPAIKYPDLEAQVDTVIKFNILPVQVRVDYLPVSETLVRTDIAVRIANKDLQFQGSGGSQKAVVNLYGRITSMTRRVVNVFEDTVTVDSPEALSGEFIKKSSLYNKSIPLAPGQYRLNVVVRDVVSGNMNNYEMALNVPRP